MGNADLCEYFRLLPIEQQEGAILRYIEGEIAQANYQSAEKMITLLLVANEIGCEMRARTLAQALLMALRTNRVEEAIALFSQMRKMEDSGRILEIELEALTWLANYFLPYEPFRLLQLWAELKDAFPEGGKRKKLAQIGKKLAECYAKNGDPKTASEINAILRSNLE